MTSPLPHKNGKVACHHRRHPVGLGEYRGGMTPQAKFLKRLYSLREAAMYLGRSTWSVRRLIWSGALPSVRVGGRVHLDVRDMDDLIDKNKAWEDA